jgi:amino acid adenylation domain-containing protein
LPLTFHKRSSDAPLIRFLPDEAPGAPSNGSHKSHAAREIPASDIDQLAESAARLGSSLENLLLAGFACLLARLTRQDVVAISVAPQQQVVFNLDGVGSFREVLRQAAEQKSRPEPQNGDAAQGNTTHDVEYEFRVGSQPLNGAAVCGLRLLVTDNGLHIELASPTGIWENETLRNWLGYLLTMVGAAAQKPESPLAHLPLCDATWARGFYANLNQTAAKHSEAGSVVSLVAGEVKRRPEHPAIVSNGRQLSYRELDDRSTALARQLVSAGAAPNRAVAVCMERAVDLPMSLLAVLKSGAYYVPLDPYNPSERLRGILEECKPVALISDSKIASGLDQALLESLASAGIPILRVDNLRPSALDRQAVLPAAINPGDLAYTIYTSGTTGKPKGVAIQHGSLLNLVQSMGRKPGCVDSDRTLAVAPISFDIATMDMFLPISTGGTLVIASRTDSVDPYRLAQLIQDHDITCMQATPVTWRMLVTSGWTGKPGLKMISGGEALPREQANDLIRLGGELWNCYGPTETTIYSAVLRIESGSGIVPVGPPMANTTFYVMDPAGQLVPPGVPGELYIGGDGVSPGYVARPELTAERFVPDRFGPDPKATLFRTGDLVRLVNGDEFEFFGRLDHQVKLRGFRIELGEIESTLRTHPAIADAVAVLREDIPGEPRLVAYVIAKGSQADYETLRAYAAKTLPEYMLPSLIVTLDKFPLSASGKINRRALPNPESLPSQMAMSTPEAAAATGELEGKLLKIFREVLRNHSIGVTDSFFKYGGYSLLTVRLFSRIDRELHVRLPISLLFDAPTVRELARVIQKGISPSVIVPIRPQGRSAPIFVIQSYLLYNAMLEIVEDDRPIYGVREMSNEREPVTVDARARHFAREITQVCSEGPLYLAGWCAAGTLTVEIARQLRESGRDVGLVALFDAERPGFAPPSGFGPWLGRAWKKTVYHLGRLRRVSWSEKFTYVFEAFGRNWDLAVENFYAANYRTMMWLQKRLGLNLSEAAFNTVYAGMAGSNHHSVRPYPGKLNLYRAADVPDLFEMDATLGWSTIAQGGVEVNFVPGDHVSMFKKPHIASLARRLQQELQTSETATSHK